MVLGEFFGVNLNEIYGETTHDLIVPQRSQFGGISGQCINVTENQYHVGSMENDEVISKTMFLLRQPSNDPNFCQDGFNPPIITYNKILSMPIQKSQNARIALTNSTVKINLPIQGKIVKGGSAIQIQATGTDLTSLYMFVSYSADSSYSGLQTDNTASFTFTIDKTEGRRSVIAIGKTTSGEYVSDSTYFYVSNSIDSVPCKSIQSGDWGSATTWSCGHEPIATDIVTINTGHAVTVSTNAAQASRIIYNGGKLIFATNSAKVFLKGGD